MQPKYDTNAPDLYIPAMGYLTYVLLVGYVLGLRNAFSPDALAATAASALVWLVLELVWNPMRPNSYLCEIRALSSSVDLGTLR